MPGRFLPLIHKLNQKGEKLMALNRLNGKIRSINTRIDKDEGVKLLITVESFLNTPAKVETVSSLVKKQNTQVLVTIEETEPELPLDE